MLDLGYNLIGDDGAKYIAEALMFANATLQKLSLKYNNIRSEGLCAMFEALEYNTSLKNFFIWGNHLEEKACIVSFLLDF